jgi:hypothetical protein
MLMVALSSFRLAYNGLALGAVAALGGVHMKQDKSFLAKTK